MLYGGALVVCLLTVLQIGLNQITGNGIDDSVFYHLRTGLGGGDVTRYYGTIDLGVLGLVVFAAGLFFVCRNLKPGSQEASPFWDRAVIASTLMATAIKAISDPKSRAAPVIKDVQTPPTAPTSPWIRCNK